jgi:hypothetical protein
MSLILKIIMKSILTIYTQILTPSRRAHYMSAYVGRSLKLVREKG